jgi:hypothetical protein
LKCVELIHNNSLHFFMHFFVFDISLSKYLVFLENRGEMKSPPPSEQLMKFYWNQEWGMVVVGHFV